MKKRFVLAIVTAILLSALIMFISLVSQPITVLSEASVESADSVLPDVTMTAVNATINDALVFKTDGADAQLIIEGIQDEVGALIFDFSEPLPADTRYQLYYSINGSGLSEGFSVAGMTDEDTDSLVIQLPGLDRYDLFRLDIDTEYQIEDISIVNSKTMFDNLQYNAGNQLTAVLRHEAEMPWLQLIMCLTVFLTEALLLAWKWEAVRKWLRQVKDSAVANRVGLFRGLVICTACSAVSLLVWFVMFKAGLSHSKSRFTLFCFADIGFAAGLLISMRRQLSQHCERGFLVIALCVGLLFAVLEPPTMLLSWDDEVHYGRAVCLNYGGTDYISDAERAVENRAFSNEISLDNKLTVTRFLNARSFRYGGNNNLYTTMKTALVAYPPSAAAIWLARMLGMSCSNTVIAGRVGNLLCYAFVAYAAIKRLRYGKLFAASLCLLPSVLFLAGNYSYDAFCIAFILLGISLWLEVYQKPELKMTGTRAVVMLLALAAGILPKTVYFPLALIVLFLPNSRFSSRAGVVRYRLAVLLTTLLLLFSIAAPFLFGGTSGESFADTRGGSDISVQNQIGFILHNPMQYTRLLLSFLHNIYFNPAIMMNGTGGCIRALAYIGLQGVVFPEKIAWAYLGMIVIAWLLSFDFVRTRNEKMSLWVKGIACVLSFGVICIVATSMYCAFTPVGSMEINGCQERYMLPVVIQLLLILRPAIARREWRLPGWTNTAVLYTEAILLVLGMGPFIQRFL